MFNSESSSSSSTIAFKRVEIIIIINEYYIHIFFSFDSRDVVIILTFWFDFVALWGRNAIASSNICGELKNQNLCNSFTVRMFMACFTPKTVGKQRYISWIRFVSCTVFRWKFFFFNFLSVSSYTISEHSKACIKLIIVNELKNNVNSIVLK